MKWEGRGKGIRGGTAGCMDEWVEREWGEKKMMIKEGGRK